MLRTHPAFMPCFATSQNSFPIRPSPTGVRRGLPVFLPFVSSNAYPGSGRPIASELDRRVQQELLNRVYDSMFHFVRLPNAIIITVRTNRNAATVGCMRGTASRSTDEDMMGRLLPCRKCSIRVRTRNPIGLLCGVTSRRVGSGCVDWLDRGPYLAQVRDPRQLSFPNRFFLQPLDLSQMIWPVFRHHLHVIGNSDPMVQFGIAGGLLQVFRLQTP